MVKFDELKPNKYSYYDETTGNSFYFTAREKRLFERGDQRTRTDMLARKAAAGEYYDGTA